MCTSTISEICVVFTEDANKVNIIFTLSSLFGRNLVIVTSPHFVYHIICKFSQIKFFLKKSLSALNLDTMGF